jgi:hypothetical protein
MFEVQSEEVASCLRFSLRRWIKSCPACMKVQEDSARAEEGESVQR